MKYNDIILNELDILTSIVNTVKNNCENREFNSVYYDLYDIARNKLSEERSDYINLLKIAQDKLIYIKSLDYNKTPTIAADR